jgi:putative heavy-metal-binding protein
MPGASANPWIVSWQVDSGMSLFDFFKGPSAETLAARDAAAARRADILHSLERGTVPAVVRRRLEGASSGQLPWLATLTPAELLTVRSHGIKPIASVSATCWLHYGWSWTEGHQQGWHTALRRLREEAVAAGANAVLDVKMRTVRLDVRDSMDFTLIGTAVKVADMPPSREPVIATVPTLELVKLLEADVVPTGIAVGAAYEWLTDWQSNASRRWMGNIEATKLSNLWNRVRRRSYKELHNNAREQGNGVLAHVDFSQMFEVERDKQPKQYLGRHIVVATTVDARPGAQFPHEIKMAVDMHAGATPLVGTTRHHQSYESNEEEGPI